MDPAPEFSVTRRRTGDAVVIAPVGEIDLVTIDALEGELESARGESARVVLDLREVSFIDSGGLRLVLEASRAIESLSVVRGPREVQRVFELVGLEQCLTMLERPPDG